MFYHEDTKCEISLHRVPTMKLCATWRLFVLKKNAYKSCVCFVLLT